MNLRIAYHKQMVDTLLLLVLKLTSVILQHYKLFSVSAPDTLEQPAVSQPVETASS